ncbi:hypothetical protein H4219_006163 [Mycoemilia scoparia]|uniref:Uncharacterized protein n=1 Tax=Mycoemilia scoparia TaxID=417184 RepID=A0A9W8DIA1_9FUNG|nr:hypothetical protein H4219_006163 [Mycoemilia scoparia]
MLSLQFNTDHTTFLITLYQLAAIKASYPNMHFISSTTISIIILASLAYSAMAAQEVDNSTNKLPREGDQCRPGLYGMCSVMTDKMAASGKCNLQTASLCDLIQGQVEGCEDYNKTAYLECDPETNTYKQGDCSSKGENAMCYIFISKLDGGAIQSQAIGCSEPDPSNPCEPKDGKRLMQELNDRYLPKNGTNSGDTQPNEGGDDVERKDEEAV